MSFSTTGAMRACLLVVAILAFLSPATMQGRELRSVGVIVADLENPFFEQLGRGVQDVAKRLLGPTVKVTVRSSGYDLDRQIQQIDAFIAEHIDLLVINAVDTEGIKSAVLRARAAGIVVVAVDVKASGAQATAMSDNRAAGTIACQYLAQRIGGKGDVLILDGPPVSSVVERVGGCRAALSVFPQIRILPGQENCGGSQEGGLACMTDSLTKYPRLDAAFAINDPTAIGANIAAARAARSEFFIVSVDGSPHGVEVMRQADSRLAATVTQHPWQMAEMAVTFGLALFAGKPIDQDVLQIPVDLLTRDKLAGYTDWGR
jgi:ribose transport system substrate-binding protein